MMGGKQDVDVIGVKHSGHVCSTVFDVHLWRNWQSLYEEHGVLKLDWVWLIVLFPDNLDLLAESSRDKALMCDNLQVHVSSCKHMICNVTVLAGVGDLELSNQVTLHLFELNLFVWSYIDEI